MQNFTSNSRDLNIAKSSLISKGFWFGALAAILGLAGVVAKLNPGKPISTTVNSVSPSSGFSTGGYNVTGPTLSAPPSSGSSPQQSLYSGSSGSSGTSGTSPAQAPVTASGGS